MDTDIEIRVERVSQLFNMLDPFPFRERDLDPEAEAYIVAWARELPRGAPMRIVVHLPEAEAAASEARGLPEAMRHYFMDREIAVSGELKELFRVGRLSLTIGCAVLAVCLGIAGLIGEGAFSRNLAGFAAEGLLILGWVALWRPMEIFLYDWWPIARQRNLFRRLAAAEIVVRGTSGRA
ncbi:UNVERIFIED_ORG: hypothetical protein ABID33_001108 [Xanthobacter viscosus]|jgi:hypothetical protein|uniref:Uncharacterized protein n=1 Tax=Xanthobacter autotrophicus TaxID=280 RepID=A0A6C1KFF8_XANAU|nr:hypothetical protein [Xanthobacter autotrophicus]TLX42965.1 hypothetical protein FBQ73_09930 [Xanthobacter autotrophicus]